MKEAEIRSLVPVEKDPPLDSIVIDSDNFMNYLTIPGFVGRESQFSPHLDLKLIKGAIEDLYNESQEEPLYTEEQKQRILGPFANKGEQEQNPIREYLNEEVARQAAVERSSVVYYDMDDETFAYTPPLFGHVGHTRVETIGVMGAGYLPLMEIHTHPSNELFSRLDYRRLLFLRLGNDPLMKSIMVLCPDVQVLALATRQTYLSEVDEVNKFFEGKEKSLVKIANRLQVLAKRADPYLERGWRDIRRHIGRYQKSESEIAAAVHGGKMSEEDGQRLQNQAERKYFEDISRYALRGSEVQNKARAQIAELYNRSTNETSLEIARRFNIKLYNSTDMQHFKAFSA